ncbi:hypothetical protein GWK47_012711 [Chionoecetes opilio]|uniref:Uncharacterized protein n=1 Tax=Chionoecetes opilio TaxID=41210 RepID=A0A8J4XWN8_CHIOP|nr:hypothetical protein GWK47_012711 [Chionoecetes opilio]
MSVDPVEQALPSITVYHTVTQAGCLRVFLVCSGPVQSDRTSCRAGMSHPGLRRPISCLCGDTPRYSSLAPGVSPSRRIIQQPRRKRGRGLRRSSIYASLHRLIYAFLRWICPRPGGQMPRSPLFYSWPITPERPGVGFKPTPMETRSGRTHAGGVTRSPMRVRRENKRNPARLKEQLHEQEEKHERTQQEQRNSSKNLKEQL